jgi:hypothetical protein
MHLHVFAEGDMAVTSQHSDILYDDRNTQHPADVSCCPHLAVLQAVCCMGCPPTIPDHP